ncbi:MAG: DUF349 domain-containing protein [Erysipelotrichaceae bacterium]|nr:DUF349 domain-containing protein [Erysipelotrichaceae bacterium]
MNEKGFDLKKELVAKAKELAEKLEETVSYQELADLRKKWKRSGSDDESFFEKELSDEFEKYMAILSAKTGEVKTSVKAAKEAIIKEAKEVSTKNYKEATAKMNELMERWKQAGRSDKETDDDLWAQFKAARDEFFEGKKAYFANLSESFAKNKEEKEAIIEEATKANAEMTNYKQIAAKMDELMESWKKIGSAGKEFEEELWNKFSEQRKLFYKNRKEYYAQMKETFATRAAAKEELIAEAKKHLARSEFSEEEVAAVKELRNKWKAVGNAGKDVEEGLWNEFNGLVNKYYENMRFYKK